jgi:hypothetical protein
MAVRQLTAVWIKQRIAPSVHLMLRASNRAQQLCKPKVDQIRPVRKYGNEHQTMFIADRQTF